jgi:hypothetical protein
MDAQFRASDEVQAWPLLLTARKVDPFEPITPSALVSPAPSPMFVVGVAPSGVYVGSAVHVLPPSVERSRLGPPPGIALLDDHRSNPALPNWSWVA